MDKAVLRNFAIESRKDLMEKIDRKIKLFYIDEEFKKDNRGDVIVLSNDKHTLTLTKEDDLNRDKLLRRIVELGYDQVVEEAAYTWFNRIIAIRYMEIHDFLPLTSNNRSLGIRVLSGNDNSLNPEILKISNLLNSSLDIGFDKNKYSLLNTEDKKFKYILSLICRKISKVIPQVFGGVTDYIDILIPDNMLSENGFVYNIISKINIDDFEQVEIIGWLYQFYNSEVKEMINNKDGVRTKNEIPSVTQIFTPDWIVKYMVENSLGKYLIEHEVIKNVPEKWNYYISNNFEKKGKKDPCNIKFIDPCCGSGHILVYAFELFYDAYINYGYNSKDIPELILKNNIYGLDVDNRAGQLSILAILLKAREMDKDLFNKPITNKLNVVPVIESNDLDSYAIDMMPEELRKKVEILKSTFFNSKEYGSLIKVKNIDYSDVEKYLIEDNTLERILLREHIFQLIELSRILSDKYEIVVTNPPYLGKGLMNNNLKTFLENEYSSGKNDLCTAFMETNFVSEDGYFAMINQQAWMFKKVYEETRKKLLDNYYISSMVHMGMGAFGNDFGTTSWVVSKNKTTSSLFIRLADERDANKKEQIFLKTKAEKNYIYKNQEIFRLTPNNQILYWISDKIFEVIKNNKTLNSYLEPKKGFSSGDNKRFLRFWYEIDYDNKYKKKWFPITMGGNYRRWYGNTENVVNYENDGFELKNFKGSVMRNTNYYFKDCISWNDTSSSGRIAMRYHDYGTIPNASGPCIYGDEDILLYTLGLMNSIVAEKIMSYISPAMKFEVGEISNMPFIYKLNNNILKLVKDNIQIAKNDWDMYEISWNYSRHPLLYETIRENSIKESMNNLDSLITKNREQLKTNEEELNNEFIKIYDVSNDIDKKVDEKNISISEIDHLRDIKALISYAVGCMFGRYSLDKDGLILAGGKFEINKYNKFIPDSDNVIPISDNGDVYYSDDIVVKFKNFIESVFGTDTLNDNLNYIAEVLGKRGTETDEETIRRYFVNDFYDDHIKTYQKRPIYWLFDSGKKNGFKCLIYLHRYDEQLVSKIRTKYLHNTLSIYQRTVEEINYKLNNGELSTTDKRELQNKKSDIDLKITECNEYDEKVGNVANKMIKLDLDYGVVINYDKFVDDNGKSILAKIK